MTGAGGEQTDGQEVFTGSFTQQEPIPDEAILAASEVLRSGRLHRYNVGPGEVGETARLEQEFAALTGARYCLAVASGGYAISCALRAAGVEPGAPVLTNAFTLAPVPGAIVAAGGRPVFVETGGDLTIDLADLETKATESGARHLVLSHMRGHIGDMDRLLACTEALGLVVIEDCAHTMGATWRGIPSGRHGRVGCFSTQTYKHVNSGEGGLLISDDADTFARAVLLSGSYMLWDRHIAAPGPESFAPILGDVPNISGRMDNLRAAILTPQLKLLDERCAAWTERYRTVERELADVPGLHLFTRPPEEGFVGSSFQFSLPGAAPETLTDLVRACSARGVELKWFGAAEPHGYTSRYSHWAYAAPPELPATDRTLATLLDMRLPLTFTLEDCALIGRIIRGEVQRAMASTG
ncbi:DegT/DnrJ/EryC1/StrS aminotransferase family protein [Tropicimonas sp. IMCC34011]|uniref:DegT/DnrJ/EryC1/StrS family aminotransferase n=1 Tax=Tropicimonas sp. IMCC34011 TaxID=2248759 RepID=UPI000E282390|nr:DegT/DnrJ/EryC1/StrS family aminotransferase [Tropicimonas sp. IMCC34011]